MYILAIETTGPFGSCALLDENTGKIVASETSTNNMSHLSDLVPMVERMLTKAGAKKSEIEYVAPSVGPGSFTGIRIGVCTARALAQALGIKAIPVGTLDAMLYKPVPAGVSEYATKIGILNARRGQVYGIIQGNLDSGAYMLDDVLEVLIEDVIIDGEEVVFYGDGIDAYQDKIREVLDRYHAKYTFAGEDIRYQDAESVAKLAYLLKGHDVWVDVEDLLPDYMREAEAETKLKAGALPICHGPKQE